MIYYPLRSCIILILFPPLLPMNLDGTRRYPVVLSTTTATPATSCVICIHLFKYLVSRLSNDGPDSLQNKLSLRSSVLIIEVMRGDSTRIQLVNSVKISPNCSCLEQQRAGKALMFYALCNLSVYKHNGNAIATRNMITESKLETIDTTNMRIVYPSSIQEATKLQVSFCDSNISSMSSESVRSLLLHSIVSKNSFVYDYYGNSTIQINDCSANSDCNNKSDMYHINRNTQIEIREIELEERREYQFDGPSSPFCGNLGSLVSEGELDFLDNLIKLSIEWKSSFKTSLFSPPRGVLLKTKNIADMAMYGITSFFLASSTQTNHFYILIGSSNH